MKNNALFFCAALATLLFAACGNDKTEPTPPKSDPETNGRMVRITHYNLYYRVPAFEGTDVRGTIDWGDGVQENYSSEAEHTYRNTMAHKVVIDMKDVRTVTFTDLTGVDEIDLSGFAASAADGQ